MPSLVAVVQGRVAAAFGVTADSARTCVQVMLERSGKFPAAYWLQIVLSLGIATLGLVLGSTAVVIGAMLISPLMAPIVELAMGLAVGSPFLVIRSALRVTTSVVVVVALSAVIVRALPFQEVTGEINARISPTALDLAIAVFCAGAAAFTTIQRGSDTAATAAGTAIGIALVPPLCVVGYGVGAQSMAIASGAALLFTANFAAIVMFDAAAFWLLGYNRVDVASLEKNELERAGKNVLGRAARVLYRLFHSRYGGIMRIAMPLVLVAAIFVPLRSALIEVAWQVKSRTAIQAILAHVTQHAVRSNLVVGHHEVRLHLVIIGTSTDADAMQHDLAARIAAVSGVVPTVQVVAVPDVETLRATEGPTAVVVPPRAPPAELESVRACIKRVIDGQWPASSAGALVRFRLDAARDVNTIHVVHLGAPIGAAAEELLASDMRACVGDEARVRDHAFSATPIVETEAAQRWLDAVLPEIGRLMDEPSLQACVEIPVDRAAASDVREALRAALAPLANRATVVEGRRWSFEVSATACPTPLADAGSDAAGETGG